MSHITREANFDGLVGPTHNYAGLAFGNVASASNKGAASSPKAAALQGLRKMKALADKGLWQAVLPPQPRPRFDVLRSLGFTGSDAAMLDAAARTAPHLLAAVYSASSMWTANAATISPSADTADGKLHLTPANLISGFHRHLETAQTTRVLRQIFANPLHFVVHDALPAQPEFADEGAANILRLSPNHGARGLEILVYGRDAQLPPEQLPKRYPARQTRAASEAVFRRHGVANALVLQQSPDAIDAGVFHNDVISVANESVLLMHERTFAQADAAMDAIRAATTTLAEGDWFHPIIIREADVPLTDAIRSYLFNTQIVRMNDGSMIIVAPMECAETPSVHAALTRITQANETPIRQVEYLDVRESMRNGGGPACLRLRVVLTEAERAASHQGIWLTDARYAQLVAWVETHYRDRLSPADLADPQLAIEVQTAMSALESILGLSLI